MARFLPTSFGKRKSALVKENGEPVPSFRVLERNEIVGAKAFDGHGTARPTSTLRPYSQVDVLAEEENMFSGLKINRYVCLPVATVTLPFVCFPERPGVSSSSPDLVLVPTCRALPHCLPLFARQNPCSSCCYNL